MENLTMNLVLFSLLIAIQMIQGDEGPKEIEQWFLKVRHHNEKVTRLHFYLHDISHGKNPTSAQVARANMTESSPTLFGRVNMMDYPATISPNPSSKLIARAQGFYASASMHDWVFFVSTNIIFSDVKYNGSSLAVLGHNPILHPYREMAIVGGSGEFRLARGVVIFKTHYVNFTEGKAIIGVDVVAMHH